MSRSKLTQGIGYDLIAKMGYANAAPSNSIKRICLADLRKYESDRDPDDAGIAPVMSALPTCAEVCIERCGIAVLPMQERRRKADSSRPP
jgi:hypothetical protein